jgi:hypothetical protein
MNTKGMIISIVTAMLVMTMFASSAMAITVDGEISPSDEWDVYDEMVTDDIGDTCSTGYDITSLRMRVEGDTLYILMVLDGVPGDADNDGNPDTYTNSDPAPCGCVNSLWTDYEGVGVGMPCPREQYGVEIDGNNNGGLDYTLMYCSGGPSLYDEDDFKILGAHTGAAHGTIVELSVDIDEYCDINPANYCVYGFADTQCNGNEDAIDPICHFDAPPTANCSFIPISCGQGTLSGTGSSDDGTIVEYAWDFYNDGTYDAYGETVSYDIVGTYDVRLMVTDDMGQTANCTLSVTLTCGPIADAKADGSDGPVTLPPGGKMVTFCGDESDHPDYPDANIISYNWTILGVDYSTTDKDECFDVFVDETTTASLKVVDDFGCEHIDTVSLRMPLYKPPSDVPILTPTGMVALISMLCIVGAGRILTKGRRL